MTYRAFFSYARADSAIANWLWRSLDTYRTPKSLVGTEGKFGPVPEKLHPIFRDKEDLSGGGVLPERLQNALEESDALIVLCTPNSATRKWVNEEVLAFQRLGRADRIFPVVASSNLKEVDQPISEYLPPALLESGLLAADLREGKDASGRPIGDGRDGGRLKLIAGLLGVPLDNLAQRERARQRATIGVLSAVVAVFVAVAALAVAASFFAVQNAERAQTNEQRAQANEQRARDTLHRSFATRAWALHDAGNYIGAARYALAGMRVAPQNASLYWASLAAVMYRAGESSPPFVHGDTPNIEGFAPDGSRVAITSGKVVEIWDARQKRRALSLSGHEGLVTSAAFSPVGSQIVTTSFDGTVRIWSARDGRLVRTIASAHPEVRNAVFSADGLLVSTVTSDSRMIDRQGGYTVEAWELRSGRRIFAIGGIGAAFSPDGAHIATVDGDIARISDVRSRRTLVTLSGHEGSVSGINYSPNGALVVSRSDDGTARVWEADTGALVATLRGHTDKLRGALFSPDGSRVVTASEDKTAKVWSAVSGELLFTLSGHDSLVSSVEFSPDGALILTGSWDNTAKLWSASDGRLLVTLSGHSKPVTRAAFFPDGRRIITASWDKTSKVWDVPKAHLRTIDTDTGVADAEFSPDGTRLVVASYQRTASIWNVQDGRLLATLAGHSRPVRGAAFSSDGTQIVTSSEGEPPRLWDGRDGRLIAVLGGQYGDAASWRAQFSPDGTRIVSAGGNRVEVWDARGRIPGERRPLTIIQAPDVWRAMFLPDGKRVATVAGHWGHIADIWDANTGRRNAALHDSGRVLAFAPDGSSFLTATLTAGGPDDQSIGSIWDLQGRQLTTLRGHDGQNRTATGAYASWIATFASDGARVATVSGGNTANIWDARTGQLLVTLSDHARRIRGVSFSPDGQRVATGSEEGTVKISATNDGRVLATLNGEVQNVFNIAFSADGGRLLVGGNELLDLWDIERLTQPWNVLARDACLNLLGPGGRRFTQAEIDADQLLVSEWSDANRDVCEGEQGVPTISELVR